MRTGECTRLMMMAMGFCLAGGSSAVLAAPATQPARTQPAPTDGHFDLEPIGYPDGVTNESDYAQYLRNRMQELTASLARQPGSASQLAHLSLATADFALTRAAEPDLTRTWLWCQTKDTSELAGRAFELARVALSHAEQALPQLPDPPARQYASRIHLLQALMALEKALLATGHPQDALQAADAADALADTVRPGGQATWDLLIAGCLLKADRREDAQVRLTRILRRYKGSQPAVAAALLQARMLADAGSYPAAVGLLSEYAQALPAMAQATQPAASDAAPAADAGIARCSLLLLKADLLKQWANKLARSDNNLDRQAAGQVRQQANLAQTRAHEFGLQGIRLLPVLEGIKTADSGTP